VSKHKPSNAGSARERVRALPWVAIAQFLVAVGRRWRALSQKDRARLRSLLRDSGGRPGNLSDKQRSELRKLVGKLELKGIGGELLALKRGGRGRRARRRRA
jgi:hypothetical protein